MAGGRMSDWSLVTDGTTFSRGAASWLRYSGGNSRGRVRHTSSVGARGRRADGRRGSGRLARRESVHRLGRQALAADGPVAALDLLDDAPRDAAHRLALDADHGVGEALGDLGLLLGREDALDELDV